MKCVINFLECIYSKKNYYWELSKKFIDSEFVFEFIGVIFLITNTTCPLSTIKIWQRLFTRLRKTHHQISHNISNFRFISKKNWNQDSYSIFYYNEDLD